MKDIDKEKNKSEDQTHYMPIFMCLGMSIGTAIGVATDNLSIYMPVGISIGLCIGSLIDAQKRNKAKDAHNDEETEKEDGPHGVCSGYSVSRNLDIMGQQRIRSK